MSAIGRVSIVCVGAKLDIPNTKPCFFVYLSFGTISNAFVAFEVPTRRAPHARLAVPVTQAEQNVASVK